MSVRVETTERAITAFGGAELLREATRAVGLSVALDDCLHLKERARGLSDTQFVMGMAESIALGAGCLDDLAVNRADAVQSELRGYDVPAPQTAGMWLRRFTGGHIRQLGKALAQAQRSAYLAAGEQQVTLDFDSTYVFSRSQRRQGVDRTYKKGYALHPLLCFDAQTGAAVHARLRRGKAGASTGISSFVTEALRAVPSGVSVRARFDSGFYSGALCDQLERAGITYLCGVPLSAPIVQVASEMADEYWSSCLDVEGDIAEFGYRLRDGRRFRRYVVKRVEIPPGTQASLWEGGFRYWVFVTNDHSTDAAHLEAEHRQKATVETGMAELKSNFGLHAFRKHGFMANWAWLLIVCLGHNLCCWTQHLGALGGGRDEGELRAKRLRYRYLHMPAMLVRSGRRLTLRLPARHPFLRRLLAALGRLRHIRPAPA